MSKNISKKILWLSYFTVAYNVVEGLVSVGAGSLSNSTALVGFGLDSFIESLSATIIIWRFAAKVDSSRAELREKKATFLAAYTFFVLGLYVLYRSLESFVGKEIASPTLIGVIIPVVSILIMEWLYLAKRNMGRKVGSSSLIADSKQTLACMSMSVTLLLGMGLNYLFGIWWLDSIAGIIIAVLLIREGFETKKQGMVCAC